MKKSYVAVVLILIISNLVLSTTSIVAIDLNNFGNLPTVSPLTMSEHTAVMLSQNRLSNESISPLTSTENTALRLAQNRSRED